MERRRALAIATAVTVTLGTGTVCFAALAGSTAFGLTDSPASELAVPVQQVEEIVVVVRSSSTTVAGVAPAPADGAAPAAPQPGAEPQAAGAAMAPVIVVPLPTAGSTTAPTRTTVPTTSKPTTAPAPTAATAPATTPTAATAPPTTAKPVTTTTRPPGVPADWPADRPIPPRPADCRKGQLEDNGVWNCEDD